MAPADKDVREEKENLEYSRHGRLCRGAWVAGERVVCTVG